MKNILLIILFIIFYGCASGPLKQIDSAVTNAFHGDPSKRVQANKSKSSLDLCLGLVTNMNFADIKKEYGQELARRNEDCSGYQAIMTAHIQSQQAASAAALNYLATTQQQPTYSQSHGTVICRNNGYGTVFCNY